MIIRFKEYQLSPTQFAAGRFDLTRDGDKSIKHVISKVSIEKGRDVIGYGYTLESAISKITHCLIADNESIVGLKEFLCKYESVNNEIHEHFKLLED